MIKKPTYDEKQTFLVDNELEVLSEFCRHKPDEVAEFLSAIQYRYDMNKASELFTAMRVWYFSHTALFAIKGGLESES